MEYKKLFKSSIPLDFSRLKFYEIPFLFFAEWLNLALELSKIIQPGFYVDIPQKQLDWYQFPDREVLDLEGGTAYTLRSTSVLLQNGEHSLQLVAQYGYENIPGQYILVKSNLIDGSLSSCNWMKDNTIGFDLNINEKHLPEIEEVFYVFQ